MKAMILAAGIGSRLQQHTNDKPKALVEIGDKPVIAYIIENLISHGFDSIVMNLHYLPEQIKEFVASQNYPCEFSFSEEEELLDTGGALKHACKYLEDSESFLLHNCDIYTDFDLSKLIEANQNSSAIASLAISNNTSDRFLWFDRGMRFVGCENKQSGYSYVVGDRSGLTPYDFNCLTMIRSKIFSYFDQLEDKFTLFDLLLAAVKDGQLVNSCNIGDSYWIDIGTPDDLEQAKEYLNARDK